MNLSAFSKLWLLIGFVLLVPLVILAFAGLGGLIPGGEPGPGDGGFSSEQLGTIKPGTVPEPLKTIFIEAGNNIGVPPALLAATSSVECGRLWNVKLETLQQWLASNAEVDRHGCNFNNGYNVWGPMQFLDTTWGLNSGDNPRFFKCRDTQGSSICAQTGRRTNHIPASVINIKDSAYGAAIKHFGRKVAITKNDAPFEGQGWTDEVIRDVARSYCNGGSNLEDKPLLRRGKVVCGRKLEGRWVGYGTAVLSKYKELGQAFEANQ